MNGTSIIQYHTMKRRTATTIMKLMLAYLKKWQTGVKVRFKIAKCEIVNSSFFVTRHKKTENVGIEGV